MTHLARDTTCLSKVRIGGLVPWILYKISEDRTETVNVADENPEVVKELEGKWYEWAEANQVLR